MAKSNKPALFKSKKTTNNKNNKAPAGKPPVKKLPPAGSAPTKSAPAGSSKGSKSTASKPAPVKSPQPSKSSRAAPAPVATGMSLDRKLDIAGITLALAGLLTLLALISSTRSLFFGQVLGLTGKAFGWGAYLLPLGLIAVGLWLVLRNFERIPTVSIERLIGIFLLFCWLLALLSYLTYPETSAQAYALAEAGESGGYAGALLATGLISILGMGGTAIALFAWLIIALAMFLDVSVMDLFRWVPRLTARLQDVWDDLISQRADAGRQPPPYTGTPSGPPTAESGLPPGSSPRGDQGPYTPFVASQRSQSFTPIGTQVRAWVLPQVAEILDAGGDVTYDDDQDRKRAQLIEETLASFGAPANVVEISRGPTITLFGVEPDFIESRGGRMRVRVGKIASLADDLALALSARTIRIQAPVPGKGYVGIEVPNEEIALVALRDVIESEAFNRLKSPLRFAVGQDVAGNAVAADLAAMPHLLVAGATGSGKSVCVNSLISCLLLMNTPDDLRLIMVDPKRVELTGYNGIPHLLAPVVVELERVVSVLQWVLREMDQRYHKLAQAGCRNIKEYNARLAAAGEKKLPHLVVIIDELADLMMLAPDETERTLTRLAQLARATGIHLVIATQRPSVDVVTGLIKANFPARIAFAVASGVDSRVILDQPGAERLLGRGDMLFQAPDSPAPTRLQGTFVSDAEILRLVTYWQSFVGTASAAPSAAGGIPDSLPPGVPLKQIPFWEEMEEETGDPLFNEAVDLARRQGRASISMLQRRLRIGYTRAARLVEAMEAKGIVGPPDSAAGTREVLDYGPAAPPVEE